jgi:hypothetical protein
MPRRRSSSKAGCFVPTCVPWEVSTAKTVMPLLHPLLMSLVQPEAGGKLMFVTRIYQPYAR